MEDKLRRRDFMESPSFRRSFAVSTDQTVARETVEEELRRRDFMEPPSFRRSFAVSPDKTVSNAAGDDDFEFIFASFNSDSVVPIADAIFSDGWIRHVYPVFDRDLVAEEEKSEQEEGFPALNFASRDLRSGSSSSSTSMSTVAEDADVKGDFCVWTRRSAPQSPDRYWKSSSTGLSGSRRHRIRDFVFGRSRSDGNEKIVFLPEYEHKVRGKTCFFRRPNLDEKSAAEESAAEKKVQSGKGKDGGGAVRKMDVVTTYRTYYGRGGKTASAGNRSVKRSYLPYRQQIVGFSCLGSRTIANEPSRAEEGLDRAQARLLKTRSSLVRA